jgi:predicted acylesterase/phospholipase RssA
VHDVLALSGGGPDGAYGVGLLRGWQDHGSLPEFDIVTGVSTGALMAPFAFLGGDYLGKLEALYTGDDVGRILAQGSALRLLSGPSIYRQRNLRGMIERNITPQMLSEIAAQHRRGRRLFIMTANLDAQIPQLWDMGAIAAQGTPQSAELFRAILLAATSIPLAFDPVLLSSSSGTVPVHEAHADASLFSLIYVEPWLFKRCEGAQTVCNLYVVVHNKTLPDPKTVRMKAADVGARAVETLIKGNLGPKLEWARRDAERLGVRFHLAYLDVPFEGVSAINFDLTYMRRIHALGRERGLAGGKWLGKLNGPSNQTKPPEESENAAKE